MNEPIAWMHTNSKQIFKTEKPNEFDLPLFTALYAHPICELIDEEIEKVGRENLSYWDSYDEGLMLFARAILKKASEK
jgi:hypothetical protein